MAKADPDIETIDQREIDAYDNCSYYPNCCVCGPNQCKPMCDGCTFRGQELPTPDPLD